MAQAANRPPDEDVVVYLLGSGYPLTVGVIMMVQRLRTESRLC